MEHLSNFMEEVVMQVMKDIRHDIRVCKCQKCTLDIAAIALNELPPKYFVTEKGELYTKIYALRQQFEVDVVSAITRAAETVSKKPRHDLKDSVY